MPELPVQGVPVMPNRTIYIADADVPLFEKAQKLAGGNLSAAIGHALRTFVEREEARQGGYEDITIKVGKGHPYLQQQFSGRLLAKRHLKMSNEARMLTMIVYQTAKGRFAVYTKNQPNWSRWSHGWQKKSGKGGNWDWDWDWSQGDKSSQDWSAYYEDTELHLDVYDTFDELKENIPEELYDAITRYLKGEDVEILDI
jgi:EXLDI family protein